MEASISRLRLSASAYAWHLSSIALIVGLMWAGIGFNLWHDYKAAEQGAAKDTANLSLTFEEDISRMVEAADQTMLFTREAYWHDPAGFLNGAWAKAHVFLDDLHMQISLVNRDGILIWSNTGPRPRIDLSDRPHFQAAKVATSDVMIVAGPVAARVDGRPTIRFVRRLLSADGSFDGITTVSLDPAYLARFYQSISLGAGSVLLATVDGQILVRAPTPPAETVPGGMLPPDLLKMLLAGAATDAPYRTVSRLDRIERIFSARRLQRYPLVLAVGLAASDVFAPYERTKRMYLAAGLVLTAACCAVGWIMLRQRQSLVDSRQALSATLDNISQGITMVRPDGSVPVMNQQLVRLLDLPPDLVAARPTFRQIVAWQHAHGEFGDPSTWPPEFESVIARVESGGADYVYERTRPNGTVLEVRAQGLSEGGVVLTFTDISDRTRNEAALAAAQARAAHAERMQALGQLAGGIAHDFNNILQAVQGGATLIGRRADDVASVQRFVRMILDATERGTSITHRLLTFARRGELRAEPLEPGDLLAGLRDVLVHTLGGGVVIDIRPAVGLPPLLADKGQLETALVNLATNARDAMPDGGTLTFEASMDVVRAGVDHPAALPAGRYVRLSIADTGTGIDPATLDRVLEPFFSTKPVGQGTGLGLSMVKGFAEQSGGGLVIESRVGHGTTVLLWLPAVDRVDGVVGVDGPVAAGRGAGSRRVLLVDDETMVRETLAAALEDAGYAVTAVANGAAALALLESSLVVDVLVTDLSMPGLDGLTVIRTAQCRRAGLPAVLLTGHSGEGVALAEDGAFALVRKPVTGSQLAERIAAVLGSG